MERVYRKERRVQCESTGRIETVCSDSLCDPLCCFLCRSYCTAILLNNGIHRRWQVTTTKSLWRSALLIRPLSVSSYMKKKQLKSGSITLFLTTTRSHAKTGVWHLFSISNLTKPLFKPFVAYFFCQKIWIYTCHFVPSVIY